MAATSPFMTRLRQETKGEIRRMQAELAALQKFERTINPQARPRGKRKPRVPAGK